MDPSFRLVRMVDSILPQWLAISMTVLDKLATALNRRDEVPNQELAKEIVHTNDRGAVKELVEKPTSSCH